MFAQRLEDGLAFDLPQTLGILRLDRRGRLGRSADLGGQVFGQDEFAEGEQRRAFHGVAQLAHVSGPGVARQAIGDGGRKPRLAAGELRDEGAGQRQDVLGPLAQRRDIEFDHVEPVEQVLAEAARL